MKILFLGNHGQFNLGDALLLDTFLSKLGTEHQYAIASHNPQLTRSAVSPKFKVEVFHATREFFRLLRSLWNSDVLFFGGRNLLKETPGGIGRSRYSSLLKLLAVVTFVKKFARKKVVMSNIGVGPLTSGRAEVLAHMILKQVDFLSVRDETSHRTVLGLGLSPLKVHLAPHAVFVNQPEVFFSAQKTIPVSDKTRIALNLNYDLENRAAWEPFMTNLAAALSRLNATRSLEIHALPMQGKAGVNDDLSALREFSRRIPNIPFVFHEPLTVQAAAEIIVGADMVLAERLHALVISAILGKPFFGLMNDMKIRELVDYLDMEKYALDVNQQFKAEQLARGIECVFDNRNDISAHLVERSAILRSKLNRYFIELQAAIS